MNLPHISGMEMSKPCQVFVRAQFLYFPRKNIFPDLSNVCQGTGDSIWKPLATKVAHIFCQKRAVCVLFVRFTSWNFSADPFMICNCSTPTNPTMTSLPLNYPTSDMIFVQLFTHPDFQAKNFTPLNSVICKMFHSQLKTRCQIWCTIELHRDPISKVLSEW